jgi:deoxyribose-phosphate aldolase
MTAIGRRAARLEHWLTRPNASLAELDAAVALAVEHDCAAVCVNPWLVKAAKRALGRSRVRLGTVVGFPHGTEILAVKAFEASKALEQGANQIDFVLNGGALASGEDEVVYNDMLAVVDMAHSALAIAGVIVESETNGDDLVRRACRLAERAGADYVVTSGGQVTARRSVHQASILRDSVGPRVQVKAAGKFRRPADVRAAAAAGATRIATELSAETAETLVESVRGVPPAEAEERPVSHAVGSRAG